MYRFSYGRTKKIRYSDDADHRDDLEAGPGHISIEPADNRHMIAGQPDLLFGLSQRRLCRVLVARLDPPTRKRDLPGVGTQMRGALGQQHRHAAGVVDERNQHRRGPQFGAGWCPPGIEVMVATCRLPEGGGFGRVGGAAKTSPSRFPETRKTRDHPVPSHWIGYFHFDRQPHQSGPGSPSRKNLPLLHTPNWLVSPIGSSVPSSTRS